MNVVIDTNILISGIFWSGSPRKILELWVNGTIKLIASPDMISEYINVIERLQNRDPELAQLWKDFLLENIAIINPNIVITACRDKKDNMFIECALYGAVQYLVSGDEDLLVLKRFNTVEIVTVNQFLRRTDKSLE